MLLSEAAMGYLVHQGKPVIDRTGNSVRLCEGLWNRTTHNALKEVLRAGDTPYRGRKTNRSYLLTEVALCGQCHNRLFTQTSADAPPRYACTVRNKGWMNAQHCRPAPNMRVANLDALVEGWFLEKFGHGAIVETVYDSGNGVADASPRSRPASSACAPTARPAFTTSLTTPSGIASATSSSPAS
ncbi:hypothetical protein ACFY2N_11035 [Streptomyces rubiginosohelvolus]|uniref:hypothetical protein n=1 Tax=Streptomyces rubiginosohelvolus TaxID=67362 RepID=UPI003686F9E5